MREIKFRAWDGERMLGPIDVESMMFADGSYYDHMPWKGLKGSRHTDAIILQYTGLKDKNGKEIYEGDVVKWFVNDAVSTAPVGFEDGAFWMLKDIETSFSVYNDWLRGEYEVIGNIYENPELIAGDVGDASVEYPDGSSILFQGDKPTYVNYTGELGMFFVPKPEKEG